MEFQSRNGAGPVMTGQVEGAGYSVFIFLTFPPPTGMPDSLHILRTVGILTASPNQGYQIMIKFTALYRKPEDAETFEQHYFGIHIPLIKQIPGLQKIEITRVTGAPMGESRYYLMAEMYYTTMDAMNAANASPQGRAAAKDLMSFAADVVTLFYGEITE